MGTIKQHLKAFNNRLKIDIGRSNKKLLVAAVILFGTSGALMTPVKGAELFLAQRLSENKSLVIEQTQDTITYSLENSSVDQSYLTANVLASLTSQPDFSDDSDQDIFLDENPALATFQENALLNQTNPITFISQEARDDIITYTVQGGDTPSSIAASLGITVNTLLWANKLKGTSIIRPGDELTILPVTGLLYRIKDGDTIESIAKKYKAETQEIIAFNNLPANGTIQVGEKLIIPDGQMPIPVQAKPTYIASSYTTGPGTGKSRSFPYGQCTWYVAQKRYVPWSGHAKYWLGNARAYSYQTGSTPQAGAIMVLSEGGWLGRIYGHVAYVESVQGNWVTISEMNYNCYGCKSVRTLKIGDYRIRGYIY